MKISVLFLLLLAVAPLFAEDFDFEDDRADKGPCEKLRELYKRKREFCSQTKPLPRPEPKDDEDDEAGKPTPGEILKKVFLAKLRRHICKKNDDDEKSLEAKGGKITDALRKRCAAKLKEIGEKIREHIQEKREKFCERTRLTKEKIIRRVFFRLVRHMICKKRDGEDKGDDDDAEEYDDDAGKKFEPCKKLRELYKRKREFCSQTKPFPRPQPKDDEDDEAGKPSPGEILKKMFLAKLRHHICKKNDKDEKPLEAKGGKITDALRKRCAAKLKEIAEKIREHIKEKKEKFCERTRLTKEKIIRRVFFRLVRNRVCRDLDGEDKGDDDGEDYDDE